jgi:hypothetical protein
VPPGFPVDHELRTPMNGVAPGQTSLPDASHASRPGRHILMVDEDAAPLPAVRHHDACQRKPCAIAACAAIVPAELAGSPDRVLTADGSHA